METNIRHRIQVTLFSGFLPLGLSMAVGCDVEEIETEESAGIPEQDDSANENEFIPANLDAQTRAAVAKQLELVELDATNADGCGSLGLLASVVDAQGRYFAFCGGNSVFQVAAAGIETFEFEKDATPLDIFLAVSPKDTPIPYAMAEEHGVGEKGIDGREIAVGTVVATHPQAHNVEFNLEQQPRLTCNSVAGWCSTVKNWAEDWDGSYEANVDWCKNSGSYTSSQRTASAQLGFSNFTTLQGRTYVRACVGKVTNLKGLHRNPCTNNWDQTFNWNTSSGGALHMILGQRWHSSCSAYDYNLRFKTSNGNHRYTGGYRSYTVP